MWSLLNKTSCALFLVIIVILIFVVNQDYIFPVYEGATDAAPASAPAPAVSEGDAIIANKVDTSNITQMSFNALLNDVDSKIGICDNLINEINSYIPMHIEDIMIGSVNQTSNIADVGINISSKTKDTLSPITNKIIQTARWTISAIFPQGKKGDIGLNGASGLAGLQGQPGAQGPDGIQGPWGECGK